MRGTVFDAPLSDEAVAQELSLNLDAVKSLFAQSTTAGLRRCASASSGEAAAPAKPLLSEESAHQVLSRPRAQHVAIVMHRVLGPACQVEDAQRIAAGLHALHFEPEVARALSQRDAEPLELLATALPTAEEVAALLAAPADSLPQLDRMVLPFARVPRVDERLRAMRLGAQAGALHAALDGRISTVAAAAKALRGSAALRQLLQAVAKLGSWINSSDLDAQAGFAPSSALDKLCHFRALKGNRDISLLHVAVLGAAGGRPAGAGALGTQLSEQLQGVAEASREDLRQLGEAVAGFRAEADWVAALAAGGSFETEVRARLEAIHDAELRQQTEVLESSWAAAREELESTLCFFAERPAGVARPEPEEAEQLLRALSSFRHAVQTAASDLSSQPTRFASPLLQNPEDDAAPQT